MPTEICFKKQDSDFSSIDTSKYTKIFINSTREDKTTKISLSKYKGDILYILSNKDFENINDYFTVTENTVKQELTNEVTRNVKKSKQGNLFGFMKKK
ncbi:uncharacterized protein VNE69_01298 [Vairimorpha necatrix]|uniref:Uncharacterized protein n=1 Tax=Vairimorpha necatrix TaxID=6039 RepID=A0AAX4J8U6_9MICR